MLRKHSQLALTMLFAADVAVVSVSWVVAYFLKFGFSLAHPFSFYLEALPVVLVVCAVVFRFTRLYAPRREGQALGEFLDILRANAVALLILAALPFFYKQVAQVYSVVVAVMFLGVDSVLLFVERAAIRAVLRALRRRGKNVRYVLVVGAGKLGQQLVERIGRNPWMGLVVEGYLDDRADRIGKSFLDVPVLGRIEQLPKVLADRHIDQVFVALPFEEHARLETIMDLLSDQVVDVRIVPDLLDFVTLHAAIDDFEGLPVVSLRESPLAGWNAVFKRAFDVGFSGAFLLVASPVLLLVALGVKLSSRGPVFYRQERMGLDGRTFEMLKFRSMPVDAEQKTGAVWATATDRRPTRFGAVLRRTSLDELPQFINVLRGEMSVVGPRPERPVFIGEFRKTVPRYMLRHKVKAGITGWAQVNGWRGNTSLEKRIQYDLYYIENWSVWFDLRIMLQTVFSMKSRHAY
jgi:Undecaprenyl-phosphate glucose phosphotransferase